MRYTVVPSPFFSVSPCIQNPAMWFEEDNEEDEQSSLH